MAVHDWTRIDAGVFHHFHLLWIAEMCRRLNRSLPPGYYTLAEQVTQHGNPDVLALRLTGGPLGGSGREPGRDDGPDGGTLVAAAPRVRYRATAVGELPGPPNRSLVVRRTNGDRVVAMIEIVSPGNKGSRHALRSFLAKARALLARPRPPARPRPVPARPPRPERPPPADLVPVRGRPLRASAGQASHAGGVRGGGPARGVRRARRGRRPAAGHAAVLDAGAHLPVPLGATYGAAFEDVPRPWRAVLEAGAA